MNHHDTIYTEYTKANPASLTGPGSHPGASSTQPLFVLSTKKGTNILTENTN